MRYTLLIYASEADYLHMTNEERAAIMQGHGTFAQEALQRGILMGGAPLQPTSTARTVQVRKGKTLVTDGPFAQTKEQLAGTYILDCCELFGVSRSWYYERTSQPESDAEEIALRDQIERIILEFSGYGYRRVTHAEARLGWKVNHKRVLRIMREEFLLCHLKKRFVVMKTDSLHGFHLSNRPGVVLMVPTRLGWLI